MLMVYYRLFLPYSFGGDRNNPNDNESPTIPKDLQKHLLQMRCSHPANMFFCRIWSYSSVKTVRFLHVVSCAQGTFLNHRPPPTPPLPECVCPLWPLCASSVNEPHKQRWRKHGERCFSRQRDKRLFSFFFCFPLKSRDDDWRRSHDGKTKKGPWVVRGSFLSSRRSPAAPQPQIVTKGFDGKKVMNVALSLNASKFRQFKFLML